VTIGPSLVCAPSPFSPLLVFMPLQFSYRRTPQLVPLPFISLSPISRCFRDLQYLRWQILSLDKSPQNRGYIPSMFHVECPPAAASPKADMPILANPLNTNHLLVTPVFPTHARTQGNVPVSLYLQSSGAGVPPQFTTPDQAGRAQPLQAGRVTVHGSRATVPASAILWSGRLPRAIFARGRALLYPERNVRGGFGRTANFNRKVSLLP